MDRYVFRCAECDGGVSFCLTLHNFIARRFEVRAFLEFCCPNIGCGERRKFYDKSPRQVDRHVFGCSECTGDFSFCLTLDTFIARRFEVRAFFGILLT